MKKMLIVLLFGLFGLTTFAQLPALSKEESTAIKLDAKKEYTWMVGLENKTLAIFADGNADVLVGEDLETTPCDGTMLPTEEDVREMVSIGSDIYAIFNDGSVRSYNVKNEQIAEGKLWAGAKVGSQGVPAKYVVAYRFRNRCYKCPRRILVPCGRQKNKKCCSNSWESYC